MKKDAVIYYTHFVSPAVRREIGRLHHELGETCDIYASGFCDTVDALRGIDRVPVREYYFHDIASLPYPAKTVRISRDNGNTFVDLPLMKFFLDHPHYEHYWIIEYDVRLSGYWPDLYTELSRPDADLLCTSLLPFEDCPNWDHWRTLNTAGETVPPNMLVKGFLPFCRVSRAAFEAIDARYRKGWSGQPEAAWPAILRLCGLKIEDIGGRGPFTPPERLGRYYSSSPRNWAMSPGTFVYRPVLSDSNLFQPGDHFPRNTLWHPVKE